MIDDEQPMGELLGQDTAPKGGNEKGDKGMIKPDLFTLKKERLIYPGQTFEVNGVGMEVRKITKKDIICRPVYRIYEP